jgi:sec-independent protein translocase protein TatB
MFDLGFSELLMIAVVALVVLGPERLPKAARFAGLWVRKARAQWVSVRSELERELAADELQRSLAESREAMHDLDSAMRETGDEARREFDAMRAATLDETAPAGTSGEPGSETQAHDALDAADASDAPPDISAAITPTDRRDEDDVPGR